MNQRTNCKNCGAVLKYQNLKDNVLICEYCRTEYYFDEYGEFKGQYITINRKGELKRFYIAEQEINTLWGDASRNTHGELVGTPICRKEKLTLIEI